ncbi:MAG TPA: thermonuclease family protein [Ensifer sp.]|nr:thermonuclease family protein [Ensifer sp.]
MRVLFLALLIIAGILGTVLLLQKGQARIAAETASATIDATKASEAAPKPDAAGPAPNPAPTSAEQQSFAGTSAQTIAAGGPQAEAPAAGGVSPGPAAVEAAAKPPAPAAPAFQIVARPAIVAAGILETTRGRVMVKDIVPLDPAETCGAGAKAWPCGQFATTQFRSFLRGRSVRCEIADPDWTGEVTARCSLGNQDVGAWLIENGWARAKPGSAYEEAGRTAEADKRGIFGADPRHP